MNRKDPTHWLLRLDADEWLAAARAETAHAHAAFARRAFRPGVTHARRAAGMALNALLWQAERPSWGRSYMDHVQALGDEPEAPAEIQAAAHLLRATPAAPPALLTLVRPGELPESAAQVMSATAAIIAWAAAGAARGLGPDAGPQLSRNG